MLLSHLLSCLEQGAGEAGRNGGSIWFWRPWIFRIATGAGAGAKEVFAIDINPAKLKAAAQFGAVPIDARKDDPARQIQQQTRGRGADVALELVGTPETMDAAVRCLAIFGRAALVGLTQKSFDVAPYQNVINKEAEIIGVSDHLASEIPALLELARTGKLQFPPETIRTVPLKEAAVNKVLDALERGTDQIRTVIVP